MDSIFRIAAQSNHRYVGELIVSSLLADEPMILQAIGVKAVYQAVKATATANDALQAQNGSIVMTPGFCDVDIDGEIRTAVRFTLTLVSAPGGASNLDGPGAL
ncbi:MAG: stage V sporulation protein S [Caldilineaceae bacterium]|nr:stage V sporulation protein S [Caldilineaceae bacterium]